MPSYDELDNEVWWVREYEPPALAAFNAKLRAKYGLTRSQCGSKGDNLHVRGRHRSRAWCVNSRYCTDRSYATTDGRDRRGPEDALRATDLGLQGPELWAVCRRVDAAVRAGKLPQLAEWFGTFDGKTVVGWSNGHASSSDSSHLYHGHFGYWTESANDQAFFDVLYDAITGDDMSWSEVTGDELNPSKVSAGRVLLGTNIAAYGAWNEAKATHAELAALRVVIEKLAEAGGADAAAILAGVDERLAAHRAAIEVDTRDAVADLAEGGAAQVREGT